MAVKEMAEARKLLSPYVQATVQSATFTSNVFNVQQYANFALQLNITNQSSLNATVTVEGSLDGTNYATIPGSSQAFTANGTFIWTTANSALVFVRLLITFAAGSANFEAYGFAKTQ